MSVALNRRLLWQMSGLTGPMEAHLVESSCIAARAVTTDAVEGARSFLEKRPPDFRLRVSRDLPASLPSTREVAE